MDMATVLIGGASGLLTAGGAFAVAWGRMKVAIAKAHVDEMQARTDSEDVKAKIRHDAANATAAAHSVAAVVWKETIDTINKRLADCESDRNALRQDIDRMKEQHQRDMQSLQETFFDLLKESKTK